MAVSADLLRLAIVREATPGVTPANPAYQLLRATSESITYTPETQLSNELNPSRQVSDVIISGGSSGGDVSFEVSSNPGFELLLEGALGNVWATDELWVGALLLTHSIEKRFTLDPNAPVPEDQYEFNRVVRGLIDTMSLTFTPGGPATGTATILAGLLTREDAEIAGSTYLPAGQLPVIVGSKIIPITFTIEGVDYTTWCVSNLVVNFRNNGRAIACLGQDAANEVVLGRFECEITADVYINAETKALMDAFLDRTEMAFAFTASDALGNAYEFTFPRVRVSAASEVAAGTNQDVIMNVTLQALVDTTTVGGAVPADVETCVLITRTHLTDPWPDPDVVLPLGGDVEAVAQRALGDRV
jgi:Phage tail tube protein